MEKAGRLKRIPFADRAQMKKLADPVMADYAKEIGATEIYNKINSHVTREQWGRREAFNVLAPVFFCPRIRTEEAHAQAHPRLRPAPQRAARDQRRRCSSCR